MISNPACGYNPSVKEIAFSETDPALIWCRRALIEHPSTVDLMLTPLRVEASHRRFFRVTSATETQSWVLMLSPPELEQNDAFINLAQVFARADLPVPRILDADRERGFILTTDLGPRHLEETYGTSAQAPALRAAIDTLRPWAAVEDEHIAPYTTSRLQDEVALFDEWFCSGLLALEGTRHQSCYTLLIDAMQEQPKGCVHRDYHCRNLLFNDGHLGIVDFQDALHGPLLYDLASLLHDCYYTFDAATVAHWLDHFAERTPALASYSIPQITRWLELTALQRQLKAIGIFARLWLRDGKASHLEVIVPLLTRMQTLVKAHKPLNALGEQIARCLERAADQPQRLQPTPPPS